MTVYTAKAAAKITVRTLLCAKSAEHAQPQCLVPSARCVTAAVAAPTGTAKENTRSTNFFPCDCAQCLYTEMQFATLAVLVKHHHRSKNNDAVIPLSIELIDLIHVAVVQFVDAGEGVTNIHVIANLFQKCFVINKKSKKYFF